jgi:hypothetical protein
VPPLRPEADLDELLTEALACGPDARLLPGEDNDCHTNAAVLWTDGTTTAIGTGYALSDDGLWRQHSWGVDTGGTVVETTEERLRYVGLVLSGADAMRFAISNAGDHVKSVLAARGHRGRELVPILRAVYRG